MFITKTQDNTFLVNFSNLEDDIKNCNAFLKRFITGDNQNLNINWKHIV